MFSKSKLGPTGNIMIGMLLGIIMGVVIHFIYPKDIIRHMLLVQSFSMGGELFLNLFRMIVVPVVLISMTRGVTSMNNPALLGRVGAKTLTIFAVTTALASTLGILLSYAFGIGKNANVELPKNLLKIEGSVSSISETLASIVPTNIFKSVVEANMLQIIFIAIICGLAISQIQNKLPIVVKLLEELDNLNVKIVEMILLVAPAGVFCLLASTFSNFGLSVLLPLSKYVTAILLVMAIFLFGVYPFMLWCFAKISPRRFYKKYLPVMLLAFSTSSSNAVLPTNIERVSNKIGVNNNIATFILSLGATINMNGTAIMQGCATILTAQLYHIDLSIGQIVQVVIMCILASVGTAGMPSAGIIMLGLVLQSVGLPIDGIALILGVDRILDMLRTVINSTGDAITAVVVSASEKQLDYDVFNRKD